jgi:hypothetical protein
VVADDFTQDADLGRMSQELLRVMQGPILKKIGTERVESVADPTISNIANVLFAYSMASPSMLIKANDSRFADLMEKALYEKTVMKDKFNTQDSTKAVWAFAKFRNRNLSPLFH